MGGRNFILDVIPVLRTFRKIIGLKADNLQGMFALGRTGWISNCGADHKQRRILKIDRTAIVVIPDSQGTVHGSHRAGGDWRQRPTVDRKHGRLSCGIVRDKERRSALP
jgi:hypothetical protein